MTLPVALPTEIGLDARRLQRAFDLLQRSTAPDGGGPPGAALVVGRHGRILEPRFFGRQGPEADAGPLRGDSLFLTASITKPVTYLGALMLVERGMLTLGDLVTRHIPEFAAHGKGETQVLHLFTHTSGLPDMLPDDAELRRRHAPLSEFVRGAVLDTRIRFAPGTGFSYQSMGTLVVAEIIQRLTGSPIGDYLRNEVFGPLGLRSTSLGADGLDLSRFARVRTPDWHQTDFGWNSDYWLRLGAPWGGMLTTPSEMAVICQMLLQGGEHAGTRLLAPGTVRLATSDRIADLPDIPDAVRRRIRWGLGWRMAYSDGADSLGELLGPSAFGHLGATGTLCWIDPDRDGFCVLFTTGGLEAWQSGLVAVSNAVAASFV